MNRKFFINFSLRRREVPNTVLLPCLMVYAVFGDMRTLHALSELDTSSLVSVLEPERKEGLKSKELRGVVLLRSPEDFINDPTTLENLKGVELRGVDLPGSSAELEKKLFKKPIHLARLRNVEFVEKIIYDYFIAHNRPFIILEAPSQNLRSGVLQFVVKESVVSNIHVEGSTWSNPDRLKKYLGLQPGDSIDQKQVAENLNFINRNPFLRADLVYTPGLLEGTTNLELMLQERRSYRFYAGAENTGIRFIGRQRLFAGFTSGNAFGLGHIFSAQYTTAYALNRFQAITTQYIAPLPWKHLLNIYGGYSSVHVNLSYPNKSNHGKSYQGSLRYQIPFMSSSRWTHEIGFGFDCKGLNNTVEFAESWPVISKLVNVTEAAFSYECQFHQSKIDSLLRGELFYSPGEVIANQENSNFALLRPGAKNHWVYTVVSFKQQYTLSHNWLLSLSLTGQWASQNLLPSEQIGIGGYGTVRGYEERELNTDTGLIANLEAKTPPLNLITKIRNHAIKDGLQFVAFIDYGYGKDHTPTPGEKKDNYLLGIGPGIRYTLGSYITARFDWGIKLHKQDRFTGGNTMVHFNVTANF